VADIWEQVILWLLDQKKRRHPDHVSLTTYGLRHNRSCWVAIDQLARYGERGAVDAGLAGDGRATVRTEGVRTFSLGPVEGRGVAEVAVDGQGLGRVDLSRAQTFRRKGGVWRAGVFDLAKEKRHSASGPIGDLFHDGLILAPGTAGSEEEAFFTSWAARDAKGYYRSRNGGVHRGGIMGDNAVDLPIVNDGELAEDQRLQNNLLLYGTYASNSVLARFEGRLPLAFDGTTLRLADRTYTAGRVAVFAVFPHPENPDRYVAVHGGVTPDAICWGAHLDMNLLPDYIVYSEGEALDWGFWGDDWKSQE
jgi:hypothetical protein